MKRIVAIILFTFVGFSVQAQQQGQYSQYMMNYFLINPAAAGTEDYIDIRAGYRQQWTGLSGAPRNYYLSAHMPINKTHSKLVNKRKKPDAYHVAGGLVSGQTLGALSHNTAYLSYAYHLPLTMKWTMSMGAIAGVNQFTLNQGMLNFGDNVADPAVQGSQTKMNFDMGIGLWAYSDNFFIGLSSMQIPQGKVDFSGNGPSNGLLNRHFYLTGGYKFQLDDNIKIIPSVLIKHTTTAIQLDINTKVRYKDFFWGGISYRRTDAVAFLIGAGIPLGSLNAKGGCTRLEIGYSYDLNTSGLRKYNSGTHELMLALLLPQKGRVLCPSSFW